MQIHELPTFTGTPGASDYFAVDDGSITSKVAGSDMVNPDAMTVAEATTGTSTAERVITPKVLHDFAVHDVQVNSASVVTSGVANIQDSDFLSAATIAKWDAILGI